MLIPVLVGLTAALSCSAIAESREHGFLQKMIGKWVLTGKIAGKDTTHDIDARWILEQSYVQIHEVSRERDARGKPLYEAVVHVSWNDKQKEFACLWLDTTEVSSFAPVGHGALAADGKSVTFQFADREDGIATTFAFDEAHGTWAWNIDNWIKGKSSPFARLTLVRAK